MKSLTKKERVKTMSDYVKRRIGKDDVLADDWIQSIVEPPDKKTDIEDYVTDGLLKIINIETVEEDNTKIYTVIITEHAKDLIRMELL